MTPTHRDRILRTSTFLLIAFYFISLCLLATSVDGANPIFFCKCVCGSKSIIIQLSNDTTSSANHCTTCTKAFCVANSEGACEGFVDSNCPSQSSELSATCFARDSYKDEFIVWLFLVTTFGLLITASVKPYVSQWWRQRQIRNTYSSMPNA
ncbi:uncharacterized protein VTP21DRAFT_8678 [Calcarisporiella thermophila]|uniref:uncharacterized protein n=1 Tax=Calcarisporiella thermophila TaxID=911321 RepID=UPI003744157E